MSASLPKLRPTLRSLLLVCLTAIIAFALTSPSARAETGALTSPPPPLIVPYTTYSGYTYLLYSDASIAYNSNLTVTISATTQTKSSVSEVGAIYQLQRWTGTEWIDVGSSLSASSTNSSLYSGTKTLTTSSGYYYRGKLTHYAKQGTVTESAIAYTSSVLST
ncbi:hypothetical protein [Cohnella fermenti]|uniref:Uncharacterized protein n=1 Tax=Cohnella fermenti TaxID=2565925 RepID=A0A4S4CF12_9BACL|nr:hypothetical protein [Cohnella fermenti]THF84595.1 hypothetical protein E6C55_01015 [Cohnella fermenti]